MTLTTSDKLNTSETQPSNVGYAKKAPAPTTRSKQTTYTRGLGAPLYFLLTEPVTKEEATHHQVQEGVHNGRWGKSSTCE